MQLPVFMDLNCLPLSRSRAPIPTKPSLKLLFRLLQDASKEVGAATDTLVTLELPAITETSATGIPKRLEAGHRNPSSRRHDSFSSSSQSNSDPPPATPTRHARCSQKRSSSRVPVQARIARHTTLRGANRAPSPAAMGTHM
jgi:hypothetical protein